MALFGNGFSLKALLEDPNLQNAPKLVSGQADLKKGGRHGGFVANANSAFLGHNIWEKPGDNKNDFDLEYMDLDEFLSENGIPVNPIDADDTQTISLLANALGQSPPRSPAQSPSSPVRISPPSPQIPGPVSPCRTEETSSKSNLGVYMPESPIQQSLSPLSYQCSSPGSPSVIERCLLDDNFGVKLELELTKEEKPIKKTVKLPEIDFNVDESELALITIPVYSQSHSPASSAYSPVSWQEKTQNEPLEKSEHLIQNDIPGQQDFDPKRRKFSEEELKPQPIIKKSRKIFVEDTMKDDRYWQRRKKNNVAAKRSRDARRVKENQIAMRASFLEQENDALKEELEKMQEENEKLMKRLAKYENV